MKPRFFNNRRNLFGTAAGCASIIVTFSSVQAASIYWDGATTAGWDAVANWSTVDGATTPDPAAVPGASDEAIFNTTGVNGNETVNLNANQLANKLTFTNTGTTMLQGGGTNRTLGIGAGGISMAAGAGAASIGSAVANQNVTTTLTASQTWLNNSTNPVTFAQNFTTSAGVNITKTGTGNVAMSNTANGTTVAGLLDIQAGKIQTAGDFFMNGGLTGAGTLENGGTASKWTFVSSATDVSFGGTIQGNPATPTTARLGLVKRGIGMLTLTGSNTVADNFNVENGTVRLTGTHNVGYAGGGQATVGSVANQNGILIVDGATINATKNSNPSFAIGTTAGSRGVVKMNTGTLNSAFQLNVGNGNGTGSYAALSMSGGVINVANWLVVGAQNDRAILNQSGGSIVETANRMTIAAGGNGSIGVSNHSGGSLTIAAGANTGIFLGENGTGTLNLSGTAAIDLQTNGGGTSGTLVFGNNGTSLAGTLNLNGGTLTTKEFVKGASTAGAVYRINFNGTTIKPNANNPGFLNDLANTLGYVNPNGAIFDTNNFSAAVNMPLRAPTGSGVSAIAVSAGGTGYLDTPLVTITGGTGTGAQAIAVVSPYVMTNGVVTSGGALTGFIITNPGVGYTSGDVLTVSLTGGGATVAATPGAVTLAANASGGMTKTGTGVLTVGGVNTYTGATSVTGGALAMGLNGDINTSSGVNVNGTGASFVQDSSVAVTTPVTVTTGTLDGTGTLSTVNMANSAAAILTHGDGTGGPITIGALNFNDAGTVNLNVTSTSAEVVTTTLNTGAAGGGKVTINATNVSWPPGLHDLITYTGAIGGGGFAEIQKGTISGLSARQTATLTNPSGKIALNITGDNPVWTGAVNSNWTTNAITGVKNWNLISNSSSHTDFITGDIVLFDDSATTSAVNISSANVSPISTTFNNFGLDYEISSTGGFGIATGSVILNGGASVALSTASTYPGGTFLNSGALRINNASAIGTGPLTIASNGVSIDNTSGAAISLSTVNAQTWKGDFTFLGSNNLNLGTGAVTLNDNVTVTTMGTATLGVGGAIGGAGFALNKAGSGTLALSGANTYSGQTNVNGGTLLLTGSINAANAANVGQVSVGTTSDNAILRITGGTLNATSTAVPGVAAGKALGGSGAIIMDSGTMNAVSELQLGTVSGGNGSMIINGGNVSYGNWISVGRDGNGVMDMNGGTLTVSTQHITEGSFLTGYGVVNLNGGTTNITNVTAGQGSFYVGERGTGILTVTGSAALNVAGPLGVRLAVTDPLALGVVNLNGGTTTTPAVTKGPGTGIFNFNGGTLKATAANSAFMTGLTNAYIFGGGATINNNGAAISIDQPLLAPTGSGLSTTGLVVAGSGFITPPQIRISGGGGIGATAIANIDVNGNLTGITITNPGTGYTSDPLFDVVGGGGSGTVTGSPTLVANTGGGLIANGAGTLGLTGASTYPGATTVAAGTLALTGTGSINSSSGITVNGSGAKFLQTSTTAVTPPITITSGGLDGVGSVSSVSVANAAANAVSNGNGGTGVLAVGPLAFTDAATVNVRVSSTSPGITATTLNSGAAGGGKITVNASKTSWNNGTVYNLIGYTSLAGGGFAEFTKGTITGLTSRQTATLTNPSGNVALSIVGDTPVWTGASDGNWTTAAITSPKNWKLLTGGTPTDFVTLDTAVFDDSATGTTAVDVGENVTPTSVIFNNNTKSYTVGSTGGFGIVGTGFLTVNGTGSVSLGNANAYSGGTFVNSGTLSLNNASAIGTGLLTVAGGTLDSSAAADVSLTTNNPTTLTGDFAFAGTKNLTLGTGAVTLAGAGTVRTVNVANNRLSIGGIPVANGYGISKAGPGTLAINGTAASAISGDLDVAAGTFEIGAQNFTATGLTGTGAIINGSAVNSALVVNNTVAKTFPGSLQNGAGVGQLGLTKQGTGTLSLTGTSNVGNEVRVEGGVLNINGGSLTATKNTKPSISVGSVANSRGFLKMASGSISTVNELNIGSGAGAAGTMPYGAMTVSGGTVTSGSWLVVAQNNDRAILNQTGGTITVSANRMTIGAGGNNAFGVTNLSGGSFNNSVGIFLGENGNGILNISGTASPNIGNMQFGGNATSLGGTLNLLGGTLNTGSVTQGASTAGAVYRWNFNGGTLKATGNNATYFADLVNTTAYVNSGGAIIDDSGFAITIGEPLLAPTGSGVSNIVVTSGGSGYIDTPFVSITGGSGTGATAVANVTGGVVTGFTITSPGVGYVPGDVLTATVFGGGATVDATVGAVNLAANTGGGLVKNGGGTVTLTGLNTYSGDTTVNNGLLSITNNGTLADGADVRLGSTGTLNLAFTGTDTVDEFFLNNVQQATGEWGAIGSGAAHTSAQITGVGRILVTSGGVSDPYTTWANSFPGLTDKTPGGDPDKDGFSNLMEFILGGNPTIGSQSIAPAQVLTPTTLVFSFKRSDESEAPATTQTVETSTNLSNWASSVIPPITIGAGNSSGTGYTVTVSENGAAPDDVTVTINRAANTAMFARLRANKP